MRYLDCRDIHGASVEEIMEELSERRAEYGIGDDDLFSVSVRDAAQPHSMYDAKAPGGSRKSKVIVSIFFWRDQPA
ncbi:MAG: hypothetical protein HY289_14925 [Planctomycetes bacterium]|nr:hypothetical protein [Planctomycetota bacterium]